MALKPWEYPPLDPAAWETPPSAVKCGNRQDWPRARRRHDYRYAGVDYRTTTPGYKAPHHIAICRECGTETRSAVG